MLYIGVTLIGNNLYNTYYKLAVMQAEKTPKLNDFWQLVTEPPVVTFDSDILFCFGCLYFINLYIFLYYIFAVQYVFIQTCWKLMDYIYQVK